MASEDPSTMFADMKKKKKKPKVAFAEEPNADADPTFPPKTPLDDPSLGPATAHEKALQSGASADVTSPTANGTAEGEEADDVKNMFADVKKKKKKKEVTIEPEAEGGVGAAVETTSEGLDFGDMKKKKKKKEVAFDTEGDQAPTEDAAPLDDFSDLKKKKKKKDIPMDLEEGVDDFSDMKKKKKKKDIPMDLEEGGETAPAEGADDFSDLKKKGKKKKTFAMEEFEKELGHAPSPSPKPKKSKKEESDEEAEDGGDDEEAEFDEIDEVDEEELGENPFAAGAGGGRDAETEAWIGTDRDYTYEELLSRFFRLLHASNPSLASSSSKRYTLAPPQIHREGNKKSVFANIGDICRRMHREPAHVISFLLVEMGTTGSVDGSGRLVIKGKFQQKQIENILRRYIVEYVTCKTCKSPDTILTKETRISFITCESCGSRQSVSAIKAGYQAQVGKRKKQQV